VTQPYRDRPFGQRFGTLGDEAEGVFTAVRPLGASQRLGWRRPTVPMTRMSSKIKHMPDFYADSGHLVEVMGLGRDGILKVKVEKYESLQWWNKSGTPVALFVWNSALRRYALISWPELTRLVGKARRAGTLHFNDGPEYYPIQWTWIEETSMTVAHDG
jgi:hypothetical protein